ncbi:hypothetical protein EDD29_4056 [Actinocorallia herbida]|uniref:WD40 repeat protein n=1 Tax=Actinocorallia herbida TaxID=58109 RepID=A0A3N1CYZ4_9ACTN|nr:hypothetical protein [Actinocorallia herbida]ROO86485.1 hypothetical protein EDD29_4056 [Actinocorallia herbida]
MADFPRIITRTVDGRVCAYVIARDVYGVLSPSAVFEPVKGDEVDGHAVTPDLRRAVYTTSNAVVSVTEGAESWRVPFEPGEGHAFINHAGCVVSADGRDVWVFRPDDMAGRGTPDHWLVLDAGTGAVRAIAEIGTSGHGATQLVHPADGRVLLSVGEGQDGAPLFRGALKGGSLDLAPFPWPDRVLVDLSPDGSRFMTVDHGCQDVAFHTYPEGEVLLSLEVADFGPEEDRYLEFGGGFLTGGTAVVAFVGETEDGEDWFGFRLVDLAEGVPGPELATAAADAYDLVPLGDGSWLTADPSGHPVRWAGRPGPSGAAPDADEGKVHLVDYLDEDGVGG